jgi:hypothetical protein
MSHRLGKKLKHGSVPAVPGAGEQAAPRKIAREACFVRDIENTAMCSFQTADGVIWMFPAGKLVAAHNADDGTTMQILYTGAEVLLEGSHLQKVRKAIARGHAFVVRAVNPAFKSEYEEEVFVSLVRVIESKPSKADRDRAAEP